MNTDALILPQGLENFAQARPILQGRWGQVYEKAAFSDLQHIGFVLTTPCISFLISGQEHLSIEGEPDLVVNSGDMVLIPPGVPFYTDFRHQDGPLRAYLFFFSRALVQAFEDDIEPPVTPTKGTVLCMRNNKRLTTFMHSLDEIYAGSGATNTVVKLKLLELLHFVAGQVGLAPTMQSLRYPHPTKRAPDIRDIMRSHFAPDLTVDDYARISGRPIASFRRDFKRLYGMPPGQWLFHEKMHRAANLLSSEDITVTEVALRLGYQSTSHFIERFRAHFGETPGQHKRRSLVEKGMAPAV